MIKKNDFFDKYKNPEGKGLKKLYKITKIDNDNIIVFDEKTGLMWQQSGSSERKSIGDAKKYIDELNKKRFAGVNDWRLPTLEEAMSLVDPRGKDLFISSLFNSKQNWIWTADMVKGESLAARVVSFSNGYCYWDSVFNENYVRAVRSGQSDKSG